MAVRYSPSNKSVNNQARAPNNRNSVFSMSILPYPCSSKNRRKVYVRWGTKNSSPFSNRMHSLKPHLQNKTCTRCKFANGNGSIAISLRFGEHGSNYLTRFERVCPSAKTSHKALILFQNSFPLKCAEFTYE